MHPIERLRFVARATGYPADVIVAEAARALASFSDDPHGLVTACRRLVSRQPGSAPLVWLCARVLCAADPYSEIRRVLVELDDESVPLDLIDQVVGPMGPQSVPDALRRTDCPVAPELFKGNIL